MNMVRTILTGTVIGVSTLWAGIAGTQYLGRKISEAVTETAKGVMDVTVKEVLTPIVADVIGNVVKDVGETVFEERLKSKLGYYLLKDLLEKDDSKDSIEDSEAQEVFREIMKQRARVDKEDK